MSIKINVKSGQNKWDVSIDPTCSVEDLKKAIAEKSEIAPESQRLIYSGKILKDDQTVESYKIQDDHSIHLVKSGGAKKSTSPAAPGTTGASGTATGSQQQPSSGSTAPPTLSTGQTGGFNPLSDLTSARYAGFLNLPSADSFGPDGGMTSAPNSDEVLRMLENPVMQSQMNEMLSNPQMIDFLIQQSPQLQSMGPQARQLLQSPMFRQMMTNPEMIRQSMQFSSMLGGADGPSDSNPFPAPGSTETNTSGQPPSSQQQQQNQQPQATQSAPFANPFASLLGNMPQPPATDSAAGSNVPSNPFLSLLGGAGAGAGGSTLNFDPALLSSLLGGGFGNPAAAQAQPDTRPPEERYEQQLRQLNDMGFFEFDRNVAALRRSGGSVQGALDALLNGDV
ncbi:LAME_0G13454g1_1 [Lachancea meyersii CBS 8951]|uniref:LAME_0G13454g1_1 n=1 Tax=Lachancea meyersii CBS 8951 TaxID=1266667 RepID=A0A1G4KA79_9SACH|nr:LAME_0G13454g1_1 [Lachancea meyersii CBS 8951]